MHAYPVDMFVDLGGIHGGGVGLAGELTGVLVVTLLLVPRGGLFGDVLLTLPRDDGGLVDVVGVVLLLVDYGLDLWKKRQNDKIINECRVPTT